jgi:hypothetical protein
VNKSNPFRHLVFTAVVLAASMFAWEAQATVLRVVVVETHDLAAYSAELKKGQAILKRMGSAAQLRLWRGGFAGDDTGRVVVTLEYPSMIVLAQDSTKALADPEYSAWLKGLDKLRKIVSDSTYDEL